MCFNFCLNKNENCSINEFKYTRNHFLVIYNNMSGKDLINHANPAYKEICTYIYTPKEKHKIECHLFFVKPVFFQ